MEIQLSPQLYHSYFGGAIYSALCNCRPATRRKFNGRLLRNGGDAVLELAVIGGVSPLRASIDDICKNLRKEGIQIAGVDGWQMSATGIGTGVTFILTMDGAFDDIDKMEAEAHK